MNIQDFIADHKTELISAGIGSLLTTIIILVVIGRNKIKWLVWEIVKIYSGEKSFFSKKRVESSIAFLIAEHGALFWIAKKYDVMSTTDFGIWAGIQLTIAGWYVNSIQKEKANGGSEVKENAAPKPDGNGGGDINPQ